MPNPPTDAGFSQEFAPSTFGEDQNFAPARQCHRRGNELIGHLFLCDIAVRNRTKGRKVFDQFALACHEYLNIKPRFAGVVSRDPRVPDSIRAQTPLPVRHPQSQAFEDVIRIVEALNAD